MECILLFKIFEKQILRKFSKLMNLSQIRFHISWQYLLHRCIILITTNHLPFRGPFSQKLYFAFNHIYQLRLLQLYNQIMQSLNERTSPCLNFYLIFLNAQKALQLSRYGRASKHDLYSSYLSPLLPPGPRRKLNLPCIKLYPSQITALLALLSPHFVVCNHSARRYHCARPSLIALFL